MFKAFIIIIGIGPAGGLGSDVVALDEFETAPACLEAIEEISRKASDAVPKVELPEGIEQIVVGGTGCASNPAFKTLQQNVRDRGEKGQSI